MSTKNPLPFSNQFERGHSFNWAGKWTAGKYYMNDEYVTDFVSIDSCVLACRQNHLSSIENKPKIIFDTSNNTPVDVEGTLWSFVGTAMDSSIYQFVTEEEYQALIDSDSIKPNTLYYIYDDE